MTASLISLYISIRFRRGCRRASHTTSIVLLTSIISTVGIALGVAILIVSFSVMNGFERELNDRIFAVIPHGEIISVNQPWKNWSSSLRKILQVTGISAAEPYINFTGLIESRASLRIIQVRGIDPRQEEKLSILSQFVRNGRWKSFKSGKHQIIIGKGIADAIKIKEGDWVSMMIPNISDSYPKLQQPKQVSLQVIGILQVKGQLDYSFAMIPLEDARVYLEMKDSITGIAVKVNNIFNANELVCKAGQVTDNYVYIKSWISTYGYIYNDIQMIRTIIYIAMMLVISVACFNIVSTLVIAVKDKSSDIAVLRTLGAKDSLIRSIFIWYGLLAGLIGSMCGIVVGVIISIYLTSIMRCIEYLIGHRLMLDDVYFINFLPSELHCMDLIKILIKVLLLGLLASWYPARRASRIDPARLLSGR